MTSNFFLFLGMKLIFVPLFFLITACNPQQAMICYYADGSANVYSISDNTLRYKPVTPAESSSGAYSGGEPQSVPLTDTQVKEIYELFGETIKNANPENQKRTMGSGMIRLGDQKCILGMRSETKQKIEKKLKAFLLEQKD